MKQRISKLFLALLILLAAPVTACSSETEEDTSPDGSAGTAATYDATDITESSAQLHGAFTVPDGTTAGEAYFELGTTPGLYMIKVPGQSGNSTGGFTSTLTGLLAYQTYYYRAVLSGESSTYGEEKRFTTLPETVIDTGANYTATIRTNHGDIVIELLAEEAPIAVNNFVRLAQEGFYKDLTFHRALKDNLIQGGDPNGDGTGDPGYSFADEEVTRDYLPGTVAMANRGANTNGCQFFIALTDLSARLGKNYTIFGLVTDGMDAATAIGEVPVEEANGEVSRPVEPVIIEDIIIEKK